MIIDNYYWWLLIMIGDYWLLLMIIIDNYCWLLLMITDYYWWLFVIIDNYYHDKITFSSIIIEVIRPVLNFLYFFAIRFHKYKKALKRTKKH